MSRQWYYINSAGTQAETVESELPNLYSNGTINDDTYVWSEHLGAEWVPIGQSPGMFIKI